MERIILIIWLLGFFGFANAQTDSLDIKKDSIEQAGIISTVKDSMPAQDSLTLAKKKDKRPNRNLPADPPRRFSLVFARTLMLSGSSPDSVPINATGSGTYSISGGLKFFMYRDIVGLRFAPGLSWTQITYESTNLKTFPVIKDSTSNSIDQERHTIVHGEASLSLFTNLTRDEDGDPIIFLEAGGNVGYIISANYRQRFTDDNGLRHKEKLRDLETVEDANGSREFVPLKYGVFGRVGYKWAALTFQYRLSDIFDEFTDDIFLPENKVGFKNPKIPPIEIGLTIFF
ncbi:MAG: hypothetical protein MRZ79_10765 [Bacteroidia bacterium]|nr:hypothetical protein [Bacteroidia bacterium]